MRLIFASALLLFAACAEQQSPAERGSTPLKVVYAEPPHVRYPPKTPAELQVDGTKLHAEFTADGNGQARSSRLAQDGHPAVTASTKVHDVMPYDVRDARAVAEAAYLRRMGYQCVTFTIPEVEAAGSQCTYEKLRRKTRGIAVVFAPRTPPDDVVEATLRWVGDISHDEIAAALMELVRESTAARKDPP